MRLWIDNTGLHSVGRCFEVEGDGEADVAGLFQLATQLVFVDAIHISIFVSSGVRQRSEAIVTRMSGCGLPHDVIHLTPTTASSFSEACLTAATRLAEDLEFTHASGTSKATTVHSGAIPDLNSNEWASIEFIHRLILEDTSSTQRQELAEEALSATGIGGHAFMLFGSDSLWEAVRRLAQVSTWTPSDTLNTIIYARYYLNEALAQLHQTEYAPAVSRARTLRKRNLNILARLDAIVSNTAKQLEPELLGVPSIANALASRCKGDPSALIEQAVRARERATDLRARLSKHTDPTNGIGARDLHSLRNELRELTILLEQDLGIRHAPALRDAFEVQFLGFIPIPHPLRFLEWAEFKVKRKRVAILSEFAQVLAYERLDTFAYEKLLKRCSKKVI